jgi:hypothetical protein
MAVGWPTKTTYANGDVYSASDVNDTNGTINLLTSSTLSSSAGKNPVINGGLDIWQRGTSISLAATAPAYTADRWYASNSANQALTVSRQATGDTTNLPNIQYALRFQRNSGQTGTSDLYLFNNFESVNSIPYAGKQVTLSFYARKGANYTAASNILNVFINTGKGTDQAPFSYTTPVSVASTNATLTTTWQRFTATGTIASDVTQLEVAVKYTPVGTASTNDYYEITGVQIELGATATSFSRAQGTIQGELAACQRYYWRVTPVQNETIYGTAIATSSSGAQVAVNNPVPMRVQPTSVDFSTLALLLPAVAFYGASGITIASNASSTNITSVTLSASGLTTSRVYFLTNNGTNVGYLGFSAEL